MSLGKAKMTAADVGGISLKAAGLTLGVAGFIPMTTDLSGVVRAGVWRHKSEVTVNLLDEEFSEDESNNSAYFGLGLQYNLPSRCR